MLRVLWWKILITRFKKSTVSHSIVLLNQTSKAFFRTTLKEPMLVIQWRLMCHHIFRWLIELFKRIFNKLALFICLWLLSEPIKRGLPVWWAVLIWAGSFFLLSVVIVICDILDTHKVIFDWQDSCRPALLDLGSLAILIGTLFLLRYLFEVQRCLPSLIQTHL